MTITIISHPCDTVAELLLYFEGKELPYLTVSPVCGRFQLLVFFVELAANCHHLLFKSSGDVWHT